MIGACSTCNVQKKDRTVEEYRAWLAYTGTTPEENQGEGWKAVHHPDYVAAVTQKLERDVREGRDWEDTFPLRGKDGNYRWFLSRMNAIRDEDGKVVRFFGTNTDVTELRDAQTQLAAAHDIITSRAELLESAVAERTSKLRDTIEELEGFSYSISHDLRAPLRAMQSFARFLDEEFGEQVGVHGKDYIRRIVLAADRPETLARFMPWAEALVS
jgi:PAS domain S-box-containing protein